MYVTTFYSFKGGVGRTMSMVNIGLKLAQNGRQVLMVDFDLEAPGIETFNLPKPKNGSLGIVDYITHYRQTKQSPDVRDYLYESQDMGSNGGKLWIMPSGMHDENYAKRLNQIKWDDIYSKEDGYLMMEDMKAQWKEYLEPDYVLIDSRTGHTDVGGICTRQLPDSVVVLFVPNEQNLLGLEKVVPTIKAESETGKRKPIHIHFVSSNVPDLDDEKQILERKMNKFKRKLGYEKLSCTIHHYNHLSLLDQEVFTQTHPRSQLTKEYGKLYDEIVKHNPEDKEGVLNFLYEITNRPHKKLLEITATELESRIDNICAKHNANGEILAKVAMYRFINGKEREALELLNQSISVGYENSDTLLMRASLSSSLGHTGYLDDIKKVLSSNTVDYFEVNRAIELLKKLGSDEVAHVPNLLAFKLLAQDSRYEIARDMSDDEQFLSVAKRIMDDILLEENIDNNLQHTITVQLSLIKIALGEYSETMSLISKERPAVFELSICDVFNYAMAEWGNSNVPPRDLFEKVIELGIKENDEELGPNFTQCMAIAYWAIEDKDNSIKMLKRCEQQIMSRPRMIFSPWRYLMVSNQEFITDLEAIKNLVNGANILPLFMKKNISSKEATQ